MDKKLHIGIISPFKKIYDDISLERFCTGGSEITNFIAQYLKDSNYKSYIVHSNNGTKLKNPQVTDLLFVIAGCLNNHFLHAEKMSNMYMHTLHWMALTKKIVWVRVDPAVSFKFYDSNEFIKCHRFEPNHKMIIQYALSRSFKDPIHLLIIPNVYVQQEKEKLYQALKIQLHHKIEFINLTGVSWVGWNYKRTVFPKLTKRKLIYIGNNRNKRLNVLWKYHKEFETQVYGNWKSQEKVTKIFGVKASYNGKIKHNEINNIYNNLTTSIITVDSNVKNLSYYSTRMWEILRYGGSFLIAEEAKFKNKKEIEIFDKWVVRSSNDIKHHLQYDYWREQKRILETITPSKDDLYIALDNLIKKHT